MVTESRSVTGALGNFAFIFSLTQKEKAKQLIEFNIILHGFDKSKYKKFQLLVLIVLKCERILYQFFENFFFKVTS